MCKPTVKYMITPHILKLSKKFFLLFFFTAYKNEWKEHKVWWEKNQKKWLLQEQKSIQDIDFNKILVSKEESYGTKNSFKHFIGYKDNDIIRPSCVRLP